MTSRPVVTIIGADGSASDKTHPLPNVFKAPIRPDIVQYANPHNHNAMRKDGKADNNSTGACTQAWRRTRGSRMP